jgi:hypothetical protein
LVAAVTLSTDVDRLLVVHLVEVQLIDVLCFGLLRLSPEVDIRSILHVRRQHAFFLLSIYIVIHTISEIFEQIFSGFVVWQLSVVIIALDFVQQCTDVIGGVELRVFQVQFKSEEEKLLLEITQHSKDFSESGNSPLKKSASQDHFSEHY